MGGGGGIDGGVGGGGGRDGATAPAELEECRGVQTTEGAAMGRM
jgi:hypothetical protein